MRQEISDENGVESTRVTSGALKKENLDLDYLFDLRFVSEEGEIGPVNALSEKHEKNVV